MSVRSWSYPVVLFLVAVIGAVVAPQAQAAGDAARGKTLGYTCLGCHGVENYKNVYPTYSVPKLVGQHPEYIVQALKGYKSGERGHATMHAHAATMSDQDMEDIAAYLAGTPIKAVAVLPRSARRQPPWPPARPAMAVTASASWAPTRRCRASMLTTWSVRWPSTAPAAVATASWVRSPAS